MNLALQLAFVSSTALLWDQAVTRLLHERFSEDERLSYILVHAPDGEVVDARWPQSETPVSVGSLVKPFTAVAYGEAHQFRYPRFTCRGTASACWLPDGHGNLGIREAIAQSCNAYFDALSAELRPADLAAVAKRFSIAPPPEDAPAIAYTGRAGLWQIAPLDIARAYARLAFDPDAVVSRAGMAESARAGTARALRDGLAKTGTAPCSHHPAAPGDGYAVALDRVAAPTYVLLVRVHGVPGAEAAATAARIMRIVREGR